MDEQEHAVQLPSAPFPAPPPFWAHFTVENEEKFKQFKPSDLDQKELPIPLAYLRPPPPPPAESESYTTLPRDELLFNPDDPKLNHAALLNKLTKSLLLNFLELTTVLSLDPTQYEEKMGHIRRLLLNVHVVINMYRPHQARESVKEMLEGILEDGQREMDECDVLKQKVEDFLAGVGTLGESTEVNGATQLNGAVVQQSQKEKDDGKQQRLYDLIHDLEGL
jgi:mediator of RNA polymerase II transcription subunit 7